MIKKPFEKLIVFSITLILCFLVLEIGLRIKEHRSFDISEGEYVQHGNSYRLRKNATKLYDLSTSTFTVKTNSLGARDIVAGEKNLHDRPYIVFMGDSQVFGMGVDYEASFVGIFAAYAAERGIDVLNLAIGGHFLVEQEEFFWDVIENVSRKPLAVFYTVNASSLNWFDDSHKTVVVKGGYLLHRSNWKSAYIKMMLRSNLSMYTFFRDIFWSVCRRLGLHDSDVRLPKHFSLYSKDSRLYDSDIVARLEEHISQFQNRCDEREIKTIYLYVPIIDSFRIREVVTELGRDPDSYDIIIYDRFIEDYCIRHDHLYLNPKPLLKEYYDKGEVLDLGRDLHYNEFANRIVGEYIIEKTFIENELF